MLRLRTLGSPALERDGRRVDGAGAQKKPLALLALLAAAGDLGVSRDKLLAYLWPEVEAEKAAHRLRQVLHALRRELDAARLFLGSADLRLNPEIIQPDIVEFGAALERGDLEGAVSLYGGPFLDGFHLSGTPEFERWVELQRVDCARRVGEALESLAERALQHGDPVGAAAWWERMARLDPLDSRVAVRLMEALAAAGNRAEALRFARRHEGLLRDEFDAAPDEAIADLAERIRNEPAPAGRDAPAGGAARRPFPAGADAVRLDPGPDDSSAPAAAAPRRWGRLPAPPTAIVGRKRPLIRLRDFLLDPDIRLITLTGPAGTGKTRLALEAAARHSESFGDGVCFVALATLREAAQVPSAIARALGVPESAGQPVVESLKAALEARHTLLVLDNFEQVVEGAAVVSELLEACPHLKVLATSRSLLRLRGEHVFPVPPLAVPEGAQLPPLGELSRYGAVRLFVQRARAVRPDFTLTAENAPAVAGICARLEGLPLSIELAAARIELLSPEALLAHLGHPLQLLTRGARDLPPRQQTLRSALAWSYELLDDAERKLFRRLSTFVGGCSVEAARAVCAAGVGLEMELLDGVASLASKSLLRRGAAERPEKHPRLGMLETIREFGLECLQASGEAATVRGAHAAFFLAFAEEADLRLAAGDRAPWLKRTELEHDNLRAALEWARETGDPETELRLAAALGRFWSFHSHLSEGRAYLQGALGRSAGLGLAHDRARALRGAGGLATIQGDWAAARSSYSEALSIWKELGDRSGVAEALLGWGAMEVWRREVEAGRARLEQSLALWEELGDQRGIALALFRLGEAAFMLGDYDEAGHRLERSAEMLRKLGDAWALALPLSYLGEIARCRGDYTAAAALYQEGLVVNRELGNRWSEALLLHNLGHVALHRGDPAQAKALFRESLSLSRDVGVKRGIALSLAGLAGVAVAEGDARAAGCLFGAAEALMESTGHVLNPADRLEFDGNVELARDRWGTEAMAANWRDGRAARLESILSEIATSTG